MKASEPIATVARQLQDETGVEFSPTVLLMYLNYAVREIIDIRPEAYPFTDVIALVQGTKQALPSGRKYLIDATQNMGADGQTPGRTILSIGRKVIDSALPEWNAFPAADVVRHVIYDPRTPQEFSIFPPQPVNPVQEIEVVTSGYPDKLTDPEADFPLTDDYELPAIYSTISWALSEATTIPHAQAKADAFYKKFGMAMGVELKSRAVAEQPQALG